MKYRDLIIEHFENDTFEELLTEMEKLPELEQVDFLREVNDLFQYLRDINNDQEIPGFEEMLTVFEQKIEEYQERILDEKLAEQQYLMAVEQRDKLMDEMDEKWKGVREYVIECIVTNADNAAAMREMAVKIIELEKDSGTYDPENWKAIL